MWEINKKKIIKENTATIKKEHKVTCQRCKFKRKEKNIILINVCNNMLILMRNRAKEYNKIRRKDNADNK
jgi:hypothetical protein